MTRYKATWIRSYGKQPGPDFDPDLVEYAHEHLPTREQAEAFAQEQAAKGPDEYWWQVEEQEYRRDIYRGVDIGRYETVARWTVGEPDRDID